MILNFKTVDPLHWASHGATGARHGSRLRTRGDDTRTGGLGCRRCAKSADAGRRIPPGCRHDLPNEVPEARQARSERGATQLVNGRLTPTKRPLSDG